MSPKEATEFADPESLRRRVTKNSELIQDAGKVVMDTPQPWGKGIYADVKRTVGTHWVSEMTNLNQKTVAVTLLVFITVIAPTLTFGAVYGKATGNHIGAIETLLGTAWVGVTYSLIGGMPICIIGSTGPVLAFSTVIYNISLNIGVPYLTMTAWISVWLLAYAFIAGFFDLTRFVRLATRFTDDIFALLIVSIFIMDAIGDPFSNTGLLRYFDPVHPSHDQFEDVVDYNAMSTALLSVILGLGTTATIFFFRGFKFSPYFCNDMVRTMIADFAVSMSVVIWTLIKIFLFPDIDVEGLQVPDQFEPTYACCYSNCTTNWPEECPELAEPARSRPWLASFTDLNGKAWVPFMAAAPAILCFALVYLDNGITWHLIYHKSHNLQHGEAYNYDLVLSGFFNFINGILGLPWLVATTVPCIIHLDSLADKDKDNNYLYVQETRLCHFFSHVLLALSILALAYIKLLPLPVLYGVFLFMGLSSLPGIQFWQRFLLFFQQPSKYPETVYTKYISKARIHKYTFIQILFFFLVFTVQNVKAIAIVFPLMTFLCIPGRLFLLPRFFEGWEILLLDGEDEQIQEWIDAKEEANRESEFLKQTSGNFIMSGEMEFDEDKDNEPAERSVEEEQ